MEYYLLLIVIGLIAGVSSGIFGIGGGVLIVPALMFLMKFPIHRAVGTSLAILLPPIGAAAVFAYYRSGNIDFKAAVIIAIMVFVGAGLGGLLANRLDDAVMRNLFGVFLLAMGAYILFSGKA